MEPPHAEPAEPTESAEPPEPPARQRPAWPAWHAPVGFLCATLLTLSLVLVIERIGLRSILPGPAVVIFQAVLQDAVLVGTALVFAARTARPRAWHFGLGGAPLERALRFAGRALLAYLAFLVVARVYEAVFDPSGEQRIVEALGADRGLGWLIAGGVLVVVLAPVAEELFFRGFFYGSLRGQLGAPGAAIASSAVFALVHFTSAQTLSLLPLLGVLGLLFCFLYERTGSLYPCIALHALNNAVAYAGVGYTRSLEGGPLVGGLLGLAMVVVAVIVPALARTPRTAT